MRKIKKLGGGEIMGHGHSGGGHHERSSNDQRSDAHNPNSQEYRDNQSNHDHQVAENEAEEGEDD